MAIARSNQEWVDQLAARDEAAIADLSMMLLRGLRRALNGRAADVDIEDFAQDAALRILVHLDDYHGMSRFPTWAHAVAQNHALTQLRRRHRRDVGIDALDPTDDVGEGPPQHAERHEQLQLLERAFVEVLSERQRDVMQLLLEDVPYAAIADRLGITLNHAYKLAHDARRQLRAALQLGGDDDREERP